jgi:cobyrinic acid a,c-diamide synthase
MLYSNWSTADSPTGEMKRIVIAAPHSGSGKTTVTLGVMAALRARGLKVAPFKVGPDFIDPGYHQLASGAASVNLDGWMCSADFLRSSFAVHSGRADIAVVEGVMGLFDGIDGVSDSGSTAEIAKMLAAPVLLVVDARSQARSAAALVHGFSSFDPEVKLAGVIFNNVGSENHDRILREAVAASCPGVAVIGCIPRDPALAIPSRHLGLLTAEENPLTASLLERLVEVMNRSLDLEALLRIAGGDAEGSAVLADSMHPQAGAPVRDPVATDPAESLSKIRLDTAGAALPDAGSRLACAAVGGTVKIAVASDAAFCFVYQDNLRLLRQSGAELSFFSPLDAAALPDGISGLYLPGGYPELFAERLAANRSLKEELLQAVEAGMPVYAECGGFIYLTRGVEADGVIQPLVGVFPVRTRMLPRRKALGYREVVVLGETIIGPAGTVARGHEFHYSEMERMPDQVERLYSVSRKGSSLGLEGYRYKNCLASYIHLHFGSSPAIAESFVGHCRTSMTRSLT